MSGYGNILGGAIAGALVGGFIGIATTSVSSKNSQIQKDHSGTFENACIIAGAVVGTALALSLEKSSGE